MLGPDLGRPQSALGGGPPASLPAPRAGGLEGLRLALSPRTVPLDDDVADGFARAIAACAELGAEIVEAPPPAIALEIGAEYLDVLYAELLVFHRRFDDRRDGYRPSLREWVEQAEARGTSAERYVDAQRSRRETTAGCAEWLRDQGIDALLEPTVPCVAPLRGDGYDHAGSDYELISLTHYWNWTGFPVVALPSAVGFRSNLPVSVSLIGPAGSDWELLDIGIQLQAALGVPAPPH
jgi:Asp-tRNA(Asn)/Glu-tRNA(Gln) amidotransferase A subunit family amidase